MVDHVLDLLTRFYGLFDRGLVSVVDFNALYKGVYDFVLGDTVVAFALKGFDCGNNQF